MKNMSSSLSLLGAFTLLLLSILNPSMFAEADDNRSTNDNFVHDTCNRFTYDELYKICIPEIDSDPREDLKTNLTGLLIILVNHSISNFNDNIEFLQREIKSEKLNGETKHMLDTCLENFERGNRDLQETMHILHAQTGIGPYELPVIGILNYIRDCVDEFEDVPKPLGYQSRYNTSWNLMLLIASMCNVMKCNRVIACIP